MKAGGYAVPINRAVVFVVSIRILAGIGFLLSGIKRELSPPEDQGAIFTAIKGPQYANLDYTEAFAGRVESVFRSLPEADTTFILNVQMVQITALEA